MGSIFKTKSAPPPPPAPDPVPLPVATVEESPDMELIARKKMRERKDGFTKTILTSNAGITDEEEIYNQSLLGKKK